MQSPTIYFFGDNHGRFDHIIEAVLRGKPDAIVLLGDIEVSRPLEIELAPIVDKTVVRFIHGNHDTDSDFFYRSLWESKMAPCNLHGRVETIAGVRIAGLGGIFRGKVWMPPAAPAFDSYETWQQALKWSQPPRDRVATGLITSTQARTFKSTIFPDVYDQLSLEEADVLVTHEAPSSHPHGFEAIDDLARALGVRKSFHGHHHDRINYQPQWSALGFEAHGVGFCGISDLNGGTVRAGDFDTSREQGRT